MWETKKIIVSILFMVLFSLSQSEVSYGSPVVYQVTEEQLNQLEWNLIEQENKLIWALEMLTKQSNISTEVKLQLKQVNQELEIALQELKQSKQEIISLRQNLQSASDSIEKANQLFDQYEKEARRTESRLKRQKTLIGIIGGLLGLGGFMLGGK